MAKYQPVKFAAMENLFKGQTNAPLVAIGLLERDKSDTIHKKENFIMKLEIPDFLSYLAFLNADAFVPGMYDLTHGNKKQNIMSTEDKIEKGKLAIAALKEYKAALKAKDKPKADSTLKVLNDNFKYFGYGNMKDPHEAIPPIKLTFYSFRLMVGLGVLFMILFILALYYVLKRKIENKKWLLYSAIIAIPLAYLATQMGWIVAEVGRQPWVIQDLMTTSGAVSKLSTGSVQLTFVLFALTFTVLLIAEIKIMLTQIKKGTNEGGKNNV